MSGLAVVDTMLLVLLITGKASIDYIGVHKRLSGYSVDHFSTLCLVLDEFSGLVLLPHILAEVSSLSRQIKPPAKKAIQNELRRLVETTTETFIPSSVGVAHDVYFSLGVTDAVILHLCSLSAEGTEVTLITADCPLANAARSLGYDAIDFRESFMA